MNVVVTGDRDYKDFRIIETLIEGLYCHTELEDEVLDIGHGAAKGADSLAAEAARVINSHWGGKFIYSEIKVTPFPAHWKHTEDCPPNCDKIQGRPAGVIRNQEMLDVHKPRVVFGFHNNPKDSRGTKDCLERAQKMGIPNYLIVSDYDFKKM